MLCLEKIWPCNLQTVIAVASSCVMHLKYEIYTANLSCDSVYHDMAHEHVLRVVLKL